MVDVAHGTSDVIAQALALSTRPVIYSHGHVLSSSPHYTQSGIIGIWPLGNLYPTMDAYAQALIETAEYLGPDHVAIGTDIPPLGQSVMPDYEAFPALEYLLARRGAKAPDIANMLGRNYLRVLGQAMAVRRQAACPLSVPAVRWAEYPQ